MEFIFTDRDYDRLGINKLQSRGYNPEVWDLSLIFNASYSNKHKHSRCMKGDLCNVLSNKKQVYSLLDNLTSSDIILSISAVSLQNYFLYKEINKKNIRLGFFQGAYLPQLQPRKSIKSLSRNEFNFQLIIKILKKIYAIIISSLRNKISADFVVTIGLKHQKEISNIFYISENYSLIKSHSLDFDKYLKSEQQKQKKIKNTIESEFIVFIDEAVTHHSDYDHAGIEPDCDEQIYYKEINNFFDLIEKEMGIKVVIAAHPKSVYENKGDLFNNRKIIYGKTAELVSNSKLVLLHASTSINFAIIYRKPLIYLTSLSYSGDFRRKINLRANELNLIPITLPLNEKDSINFSSNFEKYEDYFKNYIKYPGSSNKLFWDTVCDYLNK
tara:strand:- start:426 stop:1577 length:1152 start_codon:yes stop_codon:yes gene_type:complete